MSDKLVTMSTSTIREQCWRWFIEGFKLSGYAFHGERVDPEGNRPTRDLLRAEFDRVFPKPAPAGER